MNLRKKAVFNWSGGKDSALALQKILGEKDFEVVSLLTTLSEETLRSPMHSIPLDLLTRQAESIGIPLYTVLFSEDLKNYDDKMRATVEHFKKQGVTHSIYGDIFLEDIRTYRESKLHPLGIEVVEPLWGMSPADIIADFMDAGIKAKIIVTQADKLDRTLIGRDLDKDTLRLFPGDIDVCGENGEYHTFSYAGGLFKKEIVFSIAGIDKISYGLHSDKGQTRTIEYWQASLTA